jgi:Putative adhesin
METFAFWKAMNNQISRIFFCKTTVFGVIAAVVAVGPVAPARSAGPEVFSPRNLNLSAEAEAQAQAGVDRIPVTLSDPSRPALVKVSMVNGSITVKAHEGKEVIVEARPRNGEGGRSEGGPKRLAISTTGLSVEEENNEVRINTESYMRTIDVTVSVPVHTSLKLRAVNDGNIVVTGVDGELDVDDINGSVTLNNVSGSVVAHALNGRVLATFNRVDAKKSMAFSSLNGDIDVTFPTDLKANVSIKSDRGDVFSDFDVQLQATAPQPVVEDSRGHGGKYRVKIDKTVHGTINGGGPEIQFTNFQGQIYIRKAGASR